MPYMYHTDLSGIACIVSCWLKSLNKQMLSLVNNTKLCQPLLSASMPALLLRTDGTDLIEVNDKIVYTIGSNTSTHWPFYTGIVR